MVSTGVLASCLHCSLHAMRPLLPVLALLTLLAAAGAEEKKPHRVDFGFYGPGALNRRHHPLLLHQTLMRDGKVVFGRNVESRPGASAPKKLHIDKKAPPPKPRAYVVVCVDRNGVRTFPVVEQEKVKDKAEQNKDAKVTTAAGPFPDRTEAEKRSREILKESTAKKEKP